MLCWLYRDLLRKKKSEECIATEYLVGPITLSNLNTSFVPPAVAAVPPAVAAVAVAPVSKAAAVTETGPIIRALAHHT